MIEPSGFIVRWWGGVNVWCEACRPARPCVAGLAYARKDGLGSMPVSGRYRLLLHYTSQECGGGDDWGHALRQADQVVWIVESKVDDVKVDYAESGPALAPINCVAWSNNA